MFRGNTLSPVVISSPINRPAVMRHNTIGYLPELGMVRIMSPT